MVKTRWTGLAMFVVFGCGGGAASAPETKLASESTTATTDVQPAGEVADDSPTEPARVESPLPEGWSRYVDERFAFSVDAPVEPTRGVEQVPTDVGILEGHTYSFTVASAPGALLVMVTPGYFANTGKDVQQILDDGQAGALTEMNATLVSSENVVLDGNPGRVFRFEAAVQGTDAEGLVHTYIREGSLYQVMLIYMTSATAFAADGERFVESFRFVE